MEKLGLINNVLVHICSDFYLPHPTMYCRTAAFFLTPWLYFLIVYVKQMIKMSQKFDQNEYFYEVLFHLCILLSMQVACNNLKQK